VLAILGGAAFAALASAFVRANFDRGDQVFFVLHAAGLAVVAVASIRAILRRRGG
jgi:hypothetical protein